MMHNASDLKMGSVLFVREHTLLSWLIRKVLRFEFSHVAVYVGMGKILESDIGGVQINPISRYVDNSSVYVEVLDPPLNESQRAQMITFMLARFHDDYDYSLLFGNLLSRIAHRTRVKVGLFNKADAWICSELVAAGLKEVGMSFDLPISQVTPKDLYAKLSKEIKHDTQRS